MLICVYLFLVFSCSYSLATEKRFSGDSPDKSSNNPFMWMMIKQLDRTETRLNKVHSLSHQNHVAINNIKGMLEKDEVKENKSKVQSLEDCCKKQKTQITSLESNVSTQKKECRSIEKKVTSLLNGFQKKMKNMQYEIDKLKKNEVWLGLNDIQTEGQWKWVSDNTGISFNYWLSLEPNGGRGENCLHYCKENCHRNAYGWNDFQCGSQKGFVCEKQL
ncbi:unnamed protein product [Mytilus coruscus]|uniref:C-type lectin domain-containing protein n=1 Tax=Mytilus coruscus TaxID=42192 RepID=A0A6J8ET69_MYTCO|nr:unnamed protein product [Mytilus coruscus]